ncbi:hypothetical protein H6G32_13745 [Cylindrospermum sp. FACHB-282]|nr:hypothetical protein [Cylindrospermum sp. FACHB-282]
MDNLLYILEPYRSKALGTGLGIIGNDVDTLSETLKMYLANSNIFTCNIRYLYFLVQSSTENCLSDLAGWNIFDHGRESKFTKAMIQLVKIYQLLDKNRYKINVLCTEKSLLRCLSFLMKDLLTGKTLKNQDVIKWLPDFKRGNLYTSC